MLKAWRGAALQDGSSIGCEQAAPGNDSAQGFAHRVYSVCGDTTAYRAAAHPESCRTSRRFREPPCCQPIELQCYEAAPLQASGHLHVTRLQFLCVPSSLQA
jgi:hypothetical protein